MALSVYTPTGIVHETSVDFTKRVLAEPVHLVQYDESLPVIAVTCLDAGQYMTLTALDTVSIRMDKGDGTFIYNPALGMSADGYIVYIQITLQMTANYGRFEPVIELLRDGGYGASSPIPLFIDANPVPNSEIQSTSQWESLNDIVARANAIVAGDAVEFTEAEERENIESGENLITMFGKIKKWFTDLKNAAFCAVANNYTTQDAGYVLDARLGPAIKAKMDLADSINTDTENGFIKMYNEGTKSGSVQDIVDYYRNNANARKLDCTRWKGGSGGLFENSSFLTIGSFSSVNYGVVLGLTDNRSYGIRILCLNEKKVYILDMTKTTTEVTVT